MDNHSYPSNVCTENKRRVWGKKVVIASCLTAIVSVLILFVAIAPATAETPAFSAWRLLGTPDDTQELILGDIDNDGDLDVIVANGAHGQGGQNIILLNDGWGNFSWPGSIRYFGTGNDESMQVVVGDMNNDNWLDLVVTNVGSPNFVYLNDGTGNFPNTSEYRRDLGTNFLKGLAVGDMNGDGFNDIVAGKYWKQNLIYLNDGLGNFPLTDVYTRPFGTGEDYTGGIALGDMNEDGFLDIVVGNGMWETYNAVYLNDGAGNFFTGVLDCSAANVRCFSTDGQENYSLAVSDMNGDEHLDIIVGKGDIWSPGQNKVYLNDGSANFDWVGATRNFGPGTDWTSSVAVGDINDDGALDIVVGNNNQQNMVYLNDGSGNFDWPDAGQKFGTGIDFTVSIVAGDVDNDGDLDLVTGNGEYGGAQNAVYLNDGNGMFSPQMARPFGTGIDYSYIMALGDVDGDNDLDIFLNRGLIYLNDGTSGFYSGAVDCVSPPVNVRCFATGLDHLTSMAVGDLNGDGFLDIVTGRGRAEGIGDQNKVYINDGTGNFPAGPPYERDLGDGSDDTSVITLADINGDGYLDVVVGNSGQTQSAVYFNFEVSGEYGYFETGTPDCDNPNMRCFGSSLNWLVSLALGDVDQDGDIDIAAGDRTDLNDNRNAIYLNDGSGNFWYTTGSITDCDHELVRCFGSGVDWPFSLALGDLNADGALDVVEGNYWRHANVVYFNDGAGNFDWPGANQLLDLGSDTRSVALGDMDGDEDLDIVVGNMGANLVFLNNGLGEFDWSTPKISFGTGSDNTNSVALGDLNGDGLLDIAVHNQAQADKVYLNAIRSPGLLPNNPPRIRVQKPGFTKNANFYATSEILESTTIPISFTLYDRESNPIRQIRTFYSYDGGGKWHEAIATPGTKTTNLLTSSEGINYIFNWDTYKSGFFGQSDNLVIRIEAYTSMIPITDTVPGPYQWPYAASQTFPFRARGTQVRVMSNNQPAPGAIVYRIPEDQARGGTIPEGANIPYRTDIQGYLQGRGRLQENDQLVALLPVFITDTYTLYHTSAAPTLDGLQTHLIEHSGVQTLTVEAENALLLFNLDVSLEWDARQDSAFMAELHFNLERVSELLFDWSDGQVALGEVTIYHDRLNWGDADIRIYATNRLRPNATQGGTVEVVTPDRDPLLSDITYVPGQVRIGATWNRYGDAGVNLGDDWPRTLAHELGHYLLYLDDNYLGFNHEGMLGPVDSCSGVMADPYRQDYPYDEFHGSADWLPGCDTTLSNQATHRSDWATIGTFYEWLDITSADEGPASLPLIVTRIQEISPASPSLVLADPTFYLVDQSNSRVLPGSSARAFLLSGERLTDLGQPTLDRVLARGAQPDDLLCVIESEASRLGCQTVTINGRLVTIHTVSDWQPDVIITPVSSTTLTVTVSNLPAGLPLQMRLFTYSGSATDTTDLNWDGSQYERLISTIEPALAGYVYVWVEGANPAKAIVTDYAMGGNPGEVIGDDWAPLISKFAPAMSSDGQVLLFGDLDFLEGEFYALQAVTRIPSPPVARTIIGRVYRLLASPNAPDLSSASINFSYLGSLVPPGEESWLRLYYFDGATWTPLPTTLDQYHNNASAPIQDTGLYALMSSLEVPLQGPGWNLIAYPIQATRPITEALISIDGIYNTVYSYESTDTLDPWKVFGVGVPAWVSDLQFLEYNHSYWINVTIPITLYLQGASPTLLPTTSYVPTPPATFYGEVLEGMGFTPSPGMEVTAWVNSQLCATALTQLQDGKVVFVIKVDADSAIAPGCGSPGDGILFQIGARFFGPIMLWDNSEIWYTDIYPGYRFILPLILTSGQPFMP